MCADGLCTVIDAKPFLERAARVMFPFKSGNPNPHEEWCLYRWFILNDWWRTSGYKGPVFALDHEILLFPGWEEALASIHTARPALISALVNGTVLLHDHQILEHFYGFSQEVSHSPAKQKSLAGLAEHYGWHVNDMIYWHLFLTTWRYSWDCLANPVRGWTFDHNFTCLDDYEGTSEGLKRLWFVQDAVYGFRPVTKQYVRFYSLHCAGNSQLKMSAIYQRHLASRMDCVYL